MSPHSPSSTILFFVLLKSKTFWKSCFCLLSLLSHLFPSCIIIIIVIVIIVVTKLVLFFGATGARSWATAQPVSIFSVDKAPLCFILFFTLRYWSQLSFPSLPHTHINLFCLSTWICIIFLRQFYCTVLKNSTVPFSLRDHEHADENVVLESHLCHLLTRWLYANYVTLSFCIPCV